MKHKKGDRRCGYRYSEAFKMAVVREVEEEDLSFLEASRKYGIAGGRTVVQWVRRYGNGTRGKVIRVQRPEEIDQVKKLKAEIKLLKNALADAHVDALLERAFTQIACERAGIKDVQEFKKKAAGKLGTGG
jgi:transposase-like protein